MTGDNQDVLEFLNQTKSMYDEDSANYRMCEKAIAAVTGIEKVAKKLAYIHQCIDLYCDREELHDESYWLDYILDPEWIDDDIGWTGDKMTPNQSETPTRCDHTADISKKVGTQMSLPSAQQDHFREVTKKPEQNVYVVTYQDGDEEPVIYVFNNKRAAVAYRDEEGKNHDRIWLDEAPIFSKIMINGEWVGL